MAKNKTKNEKLFAKFIESLDTKTIAKLGLKKIDPSTIGETTTASIVSEGDTKEIGLNKLDARDIEKYLWMHPVVPRGIEIKANRMIRRGYKINPFDDTPKAKEAADYIQSLLDNSGGTILLKKWIEDTFAFGNGYLTFVLNKAGNTVLKLQQQHPIYFGISIIPSKSGDKTKWKLKIDPKTLEPSSYSQYKYNNDNMLEAIGNEIPNEKVAHLVFDTWGDEKVGISLIQYLHLTIKYLLNIEHAAAETMHRHGFNQKVFQTNLKTEKDLKAFAKNIANVNSKDALVVTEGTTVNSLTPGATEFSSYHDVFLTLLASRLGIPKPLISMDGTSTNKATLREQVKDMADDFEADELIVKQTIESQIFIEAIKIKFGKDFDKIPYFEFNSIEEDREDIIDNLSKISVAVDNVVSSASSLLNLGKQGDANLLLKFLREHILSEYMDDVTIKEKDITPPKEKKIVEDKS